MEDPGAAARLITGLEDRDCVTHRPEADGGGEAGIFTEQRLAGLARYGGWRLNMS